MANDVVYLDRFIWDKDKADRNIENHKISFEVASRVFNDPALYVVYDRLHSTADEDRFNCIGTIGESFHVITVTMTERTPYTRIISARKAVRKEIRDYEKNAQNLRDN